MNQSSANDFATTIEKVDHILLTNVNASNHSSIQPILQNITSRCETILESIDTPNVNVTRDSVAIVSLRKESSIYTLSQWNRTNTTVIYSTNIDDTGDAFVSITINSSSLNNATVDDVYIIYFLPPSLFQYAQNDQEIIIVSPIVGVHLPGHSPQIIRMWFTDQERQFGKYSCVFWDKDRWNNSGCTHTHYSGSNRHSCVCYHTTSYTLIFIPDKVIPETYLVSVIVAGVSMFCLCVSIVLSLYRLIQSSRPVSIVNIFSLCSTLALFIFLTIFLVRSHRPSNKDPITSGECQGLAQGIAITTYFFLVLTFASKTLLGLYYFSSMSFRFVINQIESISRRWLPIQFTLITTMALIPTIILIILASRSNDILIRYGDICWFRTSYPLLFVTIPILLSIGLNLVLLFGITVCLFLFIFYPQEGQRREKRLMLASMIWTASSISLGIAWIFGPFLGMLIKDNNRSPTSIITQWVFSVFVGLEGLWVLLVNIIFFIHQKFNTNNRAPTTAAKSNR